MTISALKLPETNVTIREDIARIISAPLPWECLRDKTVLVTGGGGFLAAYLIKSMLAISQLNKMNTRVVCVARSRRNVERRLAAWIGTPGLSILLQDVALPLRTDFPRADFLVHAASQASPKYYGVDPIGTLLANSIGTMYLLEHAMKSQADRFMFFSSGEVYGTPNDPNRLVGEQDFGYLDPMAVRSCYAESKRIGESMCAAWAQQRGLHTSVVRPFHTYGPGMALDDGRVFADFVADVVARRDIVLTSDGLAKRSFCYIADATIAFLTVLLNSSRAEVYNVGNPDAEISIRDLATLLANIYPERTAGMRFEVPESSNAYLQSPILRSCPNIEKIRVLGWSPTCGVEEGFRRTVTSFL